MRDFFPIQDVVLRRCFNAPEALTATKTTTTKTNKQKLWSVCRIMRKGLQCLFFACDAKRTPLCDTLPVLCEHESRPHAENTPICAERKYCGVVFQWELFCMRAVFYLACEKHSEYFPSNAKTTPVCLLLLLFFAVEVEELKRKVSRSGESNLRPSR